MFKLISTIIILIFFSLNAHAAKVSCSFDYGDAFSTTDGSWVGAYSFETLWDLFPEGIMFELDNSLLGNLDTQEVFNAGSIDKGDVFLRGGDLGIDGKLTSSSDGIIKVYSGYCDISFG